MNSAPPVLTDHRIQSMRSTVMNAVDDDITRRGRRARALTSVAAAVVVIGGIGYVGVDALNQPTGGSDSEAASSNDGDSDAKSLPERSSVDSSGEQSSPQTDEALTDSTGKAAPDEAGTEREVITTGSILATVKKPREIAQKLSTYVDSINGRVESRTENGSGGDSYASLQIRVPSTKVDDTIAFIGTFGTVENVSLQNDDVTSSARDLDARIRALRLSIIRLEKLLTEADTSAELVQAESALTQRQEQLEGLVAQRKGIADQVELSTIQVELSQKAKADKVSTGGFRGGLLDGWNAMVSTVNRIVEVVGVMLPWTVLAVVLYGAYRLVSRRRRASARPIESPKGER